MSGIFRRLFRRGSVSDDIREELEAHIAMKAELNQASGMTPEDALHAARRQFGNATAVQERLHDFNGFGWVDPISRDLVYALRGLRRSPGLSLTAILTIAIGVGAVASMFGIMRSLLLAPPPHVVEPDRVVRLHSLSSPVQGQEPPMPHAHTSYPFYERLAAHAATLDAVAAYAGRDVPAGAGADARMTRAVYVSAGFWRTLGVQPALGRFFADAEAHPATGARVVVLGHAFWRSRFAGRADAVGQTLRIKGQPYEIVGIAPRGFRGVDLADADLWLPMFVVADGDPRAANWHTFGISANLKAVMRVKADVTQAQAASELTALYRGFLVDAYGPVYRNDPARVDRLRQARVLLGPIAGGLGDDLRPIPEARVTAWLVGIAVVLVAVACANVAGLLLLRALRRRREIAVRLALGVSRTRLACQLLTESAVIACLGGLAAFVTIIWSGAWLQRTILPAMAWEPSVIIDPGILVVTTLSTLAAALIAGVAPLYYARADVLPGLREAGPSALVRRPRLQTVLLAVQGAFSIVLLVGAGLFVKSVRNVDALDIGLDRDGVLAVSIDFSGTGRSDRDVASFFERALERVSSAPGVSRASLARNIPLRVASGSSVRLPGQEASLRQSGSAGPYVNDVTPGFFETTGMRVLEGRDFSDADRREGSVIIVNATMARAGWPGRSPLGECVYLARRKDTCATVVGVVADTIKFDLRDEPPQLYYYAPLDANQTGSRALLVRTAPGVEGVDADIRRALMELDGSLPFVRIETMGEVLDPQIRPWRLGAAVFTAFGLLAMALALVGLWSSVSYGVSQRVPEFAVRLALGAKRGSLVAVVLRDGLRHAVIAVAAGLLIAAAASRFIADLLYGVSPRDPAVFGSIGFGVVVVAALASLLPARRAVRIQPVEALRAD